MKRSDVLPTISIMAILLAGCSPNTTVQSEVPAQALDLADGVYTAEFDTDSSMFRVNETCDGKGTLTVTDGQGVIHVTLSGTGYLNLYPGLAADAETDEENWISPITDTVTYNDGLSEEVFGFDIPVPAINEEFDVAAIGKKGVWYDHKVSVSNPVPAEAAGALSNGGYTCNVTLSGGSGRASVDSPAEIIVDGENITATIIWSSPHYEYMLIDGVQYDPIQTEGNSTFEIPIVLDEDMAISASTIAMSEPHLVEYTLHFDSSTIKGE